MNELYYGQYLQTELQGGISYAEKVFLKELKSMEDPDDLIQELIGRYHHIILITEVTVRPGDLITSGGNQMFLFSAAIYPAVKNPAENMDTSDRSINVYGSPQSGFKALGTFARDIINELKNNKMADSSNYLNLSGRITADSEPPYEIANEKGLNIVTQRLIHEGKRFE